MLPWAVNPEAEVAVELLGSIFHQAPEIALFAALALGYWIDKFRFGSFQLGGLAGSLLAAVLISQVGVQIGSGIKAVLFALFIYAVGFESGPQFFRSLGRQSVKEILMAVVVALSSLLTVVVIARVFHLDKGLAAGLAAGGLTQSAIIGTAGSAIEKLGPRPRCRQPHRRRPADANSPARPVLLKATHTGTRIRTPPHPPSAPCPPPAPPSVFSTAVSAA